MPVNSHRGEVSLPFGEREITLRCTYEALARMHAILFDAPPEVAERRRKWMERRGGEPLTADDMRWYHHLIAIGEAPEIEHVPAVVAALACEHHPELTADDVRRESPSLGSVHRAIVEAALLCQWRPGEKPEAAQGAARPFVLASMLRALSTWLPRTESRQASSGG